MYASKSYKRLHFTFYMYAYIPLQMNAYINIPFDIYASKLFKRDHRRQFEMIDAGIEWLMVDICRATIPN